MRIEAQEQPPLPQDLVAATERRGKGAQVELRCHAEPGPIAVLTFWSPNCSICWASRTGASVITNGDHSSLPEVGRRGLVDLVASGAQRVRRVVQSGRYGGIGVCPSNSRSTATLRPSRGVSVVTTSPVRPAAPGPAG